MEEVGSARHAYPASQGDVGNKTSFLHCFFEIILDIHLTMHHN
jgi:hypothetical protein